MDNFSLDEKLSYIGVRLSTAESPLAPSDWIDIEETIYEATLEATKDSRLFLVLLSWVSVHGDHVIIEKLMKLQKKQFSNWLVPLSIFAVDKGFHRWKKLIQKVEGEHALSNLKVAKQSIAFKGGEDGYLEFGFLIPKGSLRVRKSDVASKERLISENRQYRNRYLFGANWRADIITAIEKGYENPYRITQAIGCSYPSAYRVFKDYTLASG